MPLSNCRSCERAFHPFFELVNECTGGLSNPREGGGNVFPVGIDYVMNLQDVVAIFCDPKSVFCGERCLRNVIANRKKATCSAILFSANMVFGIWDFGVQGEGGYRTGLS